MNVTEMNTAAAAQRDADQARADARGMVFLVGMLVAGALTIAATLTVGTPSGSEAGPGSTSNASVAGR